MRVSLEENDFCSVYGVRGSVANYLRLSVPTTYRYYEAEPEAHWMVHKDFVVHVVQLGYSEFGHVDYSGLPTALQLQIARDKESWQVKTSSKIPVINKGLGKAEAYATLFLTPNAPDLIIEASWKALAKRYHPDKEGGSADDFRKFKEAYDVIRGKVK